MLLSYSFAKRCHRGSADALLRWSRCSKDGFAAYVAAPIMVAAPAQLKHLTLITASSFSSAVLAADWGRCR
jgi:hypothetical protein